MNNERILAIDDCRECSYASIVARTYDEGIKALTLLGPWDILHLDHDLGTIRICKINGREATGYNVLVFLENNPEFIPKRITIITGNPAARPKMTALAKDLMEMKK